MINTCKIVVRKSKGKRAFGRLRYRWDMNLKEIGWEVRTGFPCIRIRTSGLFI
jgi:hypothetical protein